MNREFNLLIKEASLAVTLAEQAQCISLLLLSGRILEDESEIVESILQEKMSDLVNASLNVLSGITFDFTPPCEPETTKHNLTPLNSFAARLKMALVHTKTTQAALARAINVSQGTISQIVTGKVIEAGIVRTTAIAEALGVRVNWLLYGEGEMQPAKFLTHTNKV